MMRFSLGLVLVALTLSAACGYTRFDLPAPAASTDPTEPALALAPTSAPVPQSPCRPAITPQPTQAPSPSAPARALTLTPLPKFPRPSGASQLITRRFYSAALDQDMRFLIYLPPGYGDTPRRYPVLYMLSGYDGDPHEWVNWGLCDALESLIRNGQIQPLIVVMPDGDKSWWFNHAPPPASDGKRYGDYVWQDLVSYIDANYRTLRQSQSRAIGGLSAGGQSALTLAMTHPEVLRSGWFGRGVRRLGLLQSI
ncbi:MAG: hypothetical protein HY782_00055 [Chloroflexi bacterium]|nr:hypothetical protein [Chloroflexota bacterium]